MLKKRLYNLHHNLKLLENSNSVVGTMHFKTPKDNRFREMGIC